MPSAGAARIPRSRSSACPPSTELAMVTTAKAISGQVLPSDVFSSWQNDRRRAFSMPSVGSAFGTFGRVERKAWRAFSPPHNTSIVIGRHAPLSYFSKQHERTCLLLAAYLRGHCEQRTTGFDTSIKISGDFVIEELALRPLSTDGMQGDNELHGAIS